ncbi:hypothetical protein D3C72_2287480 [compost metagenome]
MDVLKNTIHVSGLTEIFRAQISNGSTAALDSFIGATIKSVSFRKTAFTKFFKICIA